MDSTSIDWKAEAEKWIKQQQQQEESTNNDDGIHLAADMDLEENEPQNNVIPTSFIPFNNMWNAPQNINMVPQIHPWIPTAVQGFFPQIRPSIIDMSHQVRPTINHQNMNLFNVQPAQTIPVPKKSSIITESSVEPVDMDTSDVDDESQTIDARKRKLLPAWIREGLEKMEREKQKEKERKMELRRLEREEEERKKEYERTMKELENEKLNAKIEYVSEEDDNEEENEVKSDTKETEMSRSKVSQVKLAVTQRERENNLEEMMLSVRKHLTEILLQVTNELISEISKETISKYRKKAPTAASAQSSLIGLGIETYLSSDEDEEDQTDDNSELESEAVLKERIKKRKKAFEQIAREIEERFEKDQAAVDRLHGKDREDKRRDSIRRVNNESSSDNSDNERGSSKDSKYRDSEGKYDTIYTISGSRMRVRGGTRFNDVKDARNSNYMTHVGVYEKGSAIVPNQKSENEMAPLSIVPLVPIISKESTANSVSKVIKTKRSTSKSSSGTTDSTSSYERRRIAKRKKHDMQRHRRRSSSRHRDKNDREYSRSRNDRRTHHKSERYSIESKTSIKSERSNRSDSKRHRSRSRSSDRNRRRRR